MATSKSNVGGGPAQVGPIKTLFSDAIFKGSSKGGKKGGKK